MKKIVNSISEAGTLMVEALAMLGLISMVTPVLYKKAAERTVELQDINASGQMRAVSSALDSFLKDNYTTITSGGKVTVSGGDEIDFAGYENETNHVERFSGENFVKALSPYLPYGFADDDGNIRETKLFNDYDFAIAMNGVNAGVNKVNRTLTGFMVANPKNNTTEVTPMRAARIASMIGSNGGYVDDSDTARGTQGIWSVKMSDDLDINNAPKNAIVVSSLQPVSAQSLDEELLHRVDKKTDVNDRLNTMETDLFMGTDSEAGIKGHNIRMVNQIIMRPDIKYMVGEDGQSEMDGDPKGVPHIDLDENYEQNIKNALYIADDGGANISGVLNVMKEHFRVDDKGIQYYGNHSVTDPVTGEINEVIDSSPLFSVNNRKLTYGTGKNGGMFEVQDRGELLFWDPVSKALGVDMIPKKGIIMMGYGGSDTDGQGASRIAMVAKRLSYKGGGGKKFFKWVTVLNGGDTSSDVFSGDTLKYDWRSGVPIEQALGAEDKNAPYELSVNGSAFVKDTLLTANLRTYNGDFATLRAGVDPKEFDIGVINDKKVFMKVETLPESQGREASFRIGDIDPQARHTTLRVVRSEGNNPDMLYKPGILMATGEKEFEGGINIVSGWNSMSTTFNGIAVPVIEEESGYKIVGYEESDRPGFSQQGMLKLGGSKGVYINSYNNAPVAINNDMYRAYRSESGGDIWSITDINSDEYNVRPSYEHDNQDDRIGNYVIQDMITTVSASPENQDPAYSELDVFKVDPTMTTDNKLLGVNTEAGGIGGENSDESRAIEMTGSVAVYDYDRYSPEFTGAQFPSFTVDKGQVVVRATQDVTSRQIERGDRILVVDNDSSSSDGSAISDDDKRGSVYIRKGSINLAPAQPVGKTVTRLEESNLGYNTGVTPQGYIAADRFVAHNNDAGAMLANYKGKSRFGNLKAASQGYDGYEVNPAYTSVMHDIKLTTRGGARLSDILPDFINKGIYLVDASYVESTPWAKDDFRPIDWVRSGHEVNPGANASAFLGFVPTPKCPPNYARVITLTPASWAMAQAGKLYPGAADVGMNTDTHDILYGGGDPSANALNFQKSTWLKSMVVKYYGDTATGDSDGFKGWSAIMGFIYPSTVWDKNINGAAVSTAADGDEFVYWNLFPVKYKELEGYATVYCYFDRKSYGQYDAKKFVDTTYDQLKDMEDHESVLTGRLKGTTSDSESSKAYLERLDDPALKYESPW